MTNQKNAEPVELKNKTEKPASYSAPENSPLPRRQFKPNQSTTETQGARIISRA